MRKFRIAATRVSVLALVFQSVWPPAVNAGDLAKGIYRAVNEPVDLLFNRKKPPQSKDSTIEVLAKEIDWLEHHIETYGTAVPKQPDVWGEARLTKHREQFEEVVVKQLTEFKPTLQASIQRSDNAYLALAFALQGASGDGFLGQSAQQLVAVGPGPTAPTGPDTSRFTTFFGSSNLSIEPTLFVDQLSRYLNHLNHLRRINEGDDTSDSPGYALYMVRIPISVLPGARTRKGFGAEVTLTAQPCLSDDLLPTTFRNLVVNDIADQLALGVTKIVECPDMIKAVETIIEVLDEKEDEEKEPGMAQKAERLNSDGQEIPPDLPANKLKSVAPAESPKTAVQRLDRQRTYDNAQSVLQLPRNPREYTRAGLETAITKSPPGEKLKELQAAMSASTAVRTRRSRYSFPGTQVIDVFGPGHVLGHVVIDANRALRHIPDRHVTDVHAFLKTELEAAYEFLAQERDLWKHCSPQLAYAIYGRKRYVPEKVGDAGVRDRTGGLHQPSIYALRQCFFNDIKSHYPRAGHTTTASLAWAIIVESALLNQQLIEDIQRTALSRGGACLAGIGNAWPKFFLPPAKGRLMTQDCPTDIASQAAALDGPPGTVDEHQAEVQEASQLFKQYVAIRWPVQVFALDPVTDDQNVADSFSRRRELQLAISVAVAQGSVSPSAAGRFVRQLETDIDTISLNRTAVGFSHGNDTFGWRFYPRVQTPPTVGNIRAFGETLLGGPSRDWDLRQRELEPGIRECTAIIVMPSFVPRVTFDSRTNWFGLTNPRNKELTLHDTMKLSRSHQSIHTSLACVRHSDAYRPGDVSRMMRVVDQLDRRMPLQTMFVPVPIENTLGGFELFNAGVTDLAPELIGFYGEPGVIGGRTTQLFLVGKNFSVHSTQIVAGGRLAQHHLLSREIAQVDIPSDAVETFEEVCGQRRPVIDVHVATPYGISGHLWIPLINAAKPEVEAQVAQVRSIVEAATFKLASPANALFTFEYDPRNGDPDWTSTSPVGAKPEPIIFVCQDAKTAQIPIDNVNVFLVLRAGQTVLGPVLQVKTDLPLDKGRLAVPAEEVNGALAKLVVAKSVQELNRFTNNNAAQLELQSVFFIETNREKAAEGGYRHIPMKAIGELPVILHLRSGKGKAEPKEDPMGRLFPVQSTVSQASGMRRLPSSY